MKKYQDCSTCGASKGTIYKKDIVDEVKLKGLKKFTVTTPGWECQICGEIYFGVKECKIYDKLVAQEEARQLARKVKASEITSVSEAAKILKISRQAIHKILKRGQIKFVYIGNQMCPLKSDVEKYALKRSA